MQSIVTLLCKLDRRVVFLSSKCQFGIWWNGLLDFERSENASTSLYWLGYNDAYNIFILHVSYRLTLFGKAKAFKNFHAPTVTVNLINADASSGKKCYLNAIHILFRAFHAVFVPYNTHHLRNRLFINSQYNSLFSFRFFPDSIAMYEKH